MLEGFRRLLGGKAPPTDSQTATQAALSSFDEWSRRAQVQIRSPRDSGGLIVEGKTDCLPWRIEWGASQRPYVPGQELRIRATLPLPPDLQANLQAIVLDRPLQEAIEKAMFEQFVEDVQTRIDTDTPAEMRWIVMHPRLARAELGELHERYAAAASLKPWLQQWLAGPLAPALLARRDEAGTPFVLTLNRGRLTLRTALEEASPGSVEPQLRLFETALREARSVRFDDDPG